MITASTCCQCFYQRNMICIRRINVFIKKKNSVLNIYFDLFFHWKTENFQICAIWQRTSVFKSCIRPVLDHKLSNYIWIKTKTEKMHKY